MRNKRFLPSTVFAYELAKRENVIQHGMTVEDLDDVVRCIMRETGISMSMKVNQTESHDS